MEQKFTVKIQKIGGVLAPEVHSFSTPLVIEPEDDVSIRRGFLYGTIEVSSGSSFDSGLVVKVVTDTIQNEYFNNPEGTPLSCLEKSITTIRDRIFSLLQDPKAVSSGVIEFHAVISVLWGSVLYVVQYGNGCSYLVREGKIKPINSSTEGNFSVASGVVKDLDIIVLGSKGFCEKYTPEALINASSSIAESKDIAALLLKFTIEKKGESLRSLDIRDPLYEKIKVRRGPGLYSKKKVLSLIALILAILLAVSVSYAFRKNKVVVKTNALASAVKTGRENLTQAVSFIGVDNKKANDLLESNKKLLEEAKNKDNSPEVTELLTQTIQKLDEVNKVKRIADKVFYDLRVDDSTAEPTEISVLSSNSLLIADTGKSKFYKLVFAESPSVSVIESTQAAEPKFLSPVDNGVVFMGKDGFYSFDGGNSAVKKMAISFSFPLSELSDAVSYIGNVYAVHGGDIVKGSDGVSSVVWASDETFKDSVSLSVDSSIYVLTKNGKIVKYTKGSKDTFEIKGFEGVIGGPVLIYTTSDLNNLYVLDKGGDLNEGFSAGDGAVSGRVMVFDKEGNFKSQYVLGSSSVNGGGGSTSGSGVGTGAGVEMRGIAVSRDEKFLFVLAGSKVYKVEL